MAMAGAAVEAANGSKTVAFIFPLASGHVNPSLPVARQLVELGHRVHYLCYEQMREAIEGTGATFHNAVELQPEFFEGRKPDPFGATNCLMKDFGIDDMVVGMMTLRNVVDSLQLPGALRWFRQLQPDVIVFCPLVNREAALAAKELGIPAVGLLTVAGPGCCRSFLDETLEKIGLTMEDLERKILELEPAQKAVQQLNADYGLNLPAGLPRPFGILDTILMSALTLVTTAEELKDPVEPDLEEAYEAAGADFRYVGPLLDVAGARRAGGHRFEQETDSPQTAPTSGVELVARVRAAREAGRPVVLASMGTVVTGDIPQWGWAGRTIGPDGQPRGLTGCQLCRAAWGGTFDAFGAERAEDGPLILISLGPQPDPLGDVVAPPNAICVPYLPQVDILKEGIQLFLTHGGQNSFMESVSNGTPVVVCPGFGDQVINSRKAASLGLGLKVDRPDPDQGLEEEAAAAYRQEVCRAMTKVFGNDKFVKTAKECAERLREAGGVERAVQLVLEVANQGSPTEQRRPQPQPQPPLQSTVAEKLEVAPSDGTAVALPGHAGA